MLGTFIDLSFIQGMMLFSILNSGVWSNCPTKWDSLALGGCVLVAAAGSEMS